MVPRHPLPANVDLIANTCPAVVSWFLEGHPRAGEFFFPAILPDDVPSWNDKTSHFKTMRRLKWASDDDKEIIRAGVRLLFEYLKVNDDFQYSDDVCFSPLVLLIFKR
jgi:hypothetical protein